MGDTGLNGESKEVTVRGDPGIKRQGIKGIKEQGIKRNQRNQEDHALDRPDFRVDFVIF
jgi:hypothetical protein